MKKKNYKEALLWAIIIILVMFIISLDVIWLKTNPITKVEQEDSQQATYVEWRNRLYTIKKYERYI